jgi:hypothetical protein
MMELRDNRAGRHFPLAHAALGLFSELIAALEDLAVVCTRSAIAVFDAVSASARDRRRR